MSANLSRLTIGSLSLTPAFDASVTEYTATTTNATNTITAIAEDENATVDIILNGQTEIKSGNPATWVDGENALTIHVANGGAGKVYTVIVTKE